MKILIVAYCFPPESSSGSFRPMHFARHLEKMGEEIYVLTARKEDYPSYQPMDDNLLEQLSDTIQIIRSRMYQPREAIIRLRDRILGKTEFTEDSDTKSERHGEKGNVPSNTSLFQRFKDTITDLLSTPDTEIGWLPSAVKEGSKLIKTRDIDVIYATGGPWTSLLIGVFLKKFTRRPLILDFRDPWTANYEFRFRAKLIRSFESWMECKILASVDHIVTNTEKLKQDFLRRYPFLTTNTLTTIPNGFEEYIESHEYKSKALTLTHAGILIFRNPRRSFEAALNLIEKNVIPKDEIRFVLLGGFFIDDPALDDLLQHPLLDNVVEVLPRLPYQDAVRYQNNSDVLFLIQPENFPLQVPRKLYEYIAFRKPILGITDPNGATAKMIQENEVGIVVPDQTPELELALKTFYEQWKKGGLKPLSTKKCDEFKNSNLTVKLRKVFRECVDGQG